MKKPIIDFQILCNFDPRVILIADSSQWEHIALKPSIIEITLPGTENIITHTFTKGQVTILNSINLLLNCDTDCGCDCPEYHNLPDGVYGFKVIGSPDSFNCDKKYLNNKNTRLELDQLWAEMELQCENINLEKKKLLDEVDILLTAAEANTRRGNIQDAQDCLFKAQDLITSAKKCKNCY